MRAKNAICVFVGDAGFVERELEESVSLTLGVGDSRLEVHSNGERMGITMLNIPAGKEGGIILHRSQVPFILDALKAFMEKQDG